LYYFFFSYRQEVGDKYLFRIFSYERYITFSYAFWQTLALNNDVAMFGFIKFVELSFKNHHFDYPNETATML